MKKNRSELAAVPALASRRGPGRPKKEAPAPVDAGFSQAAYEVVLSSEAAARKNAADAVLVVAERDERVAALAAQLNYHGATDPGTLENSTREAIRRLHMGIFELGSYLLLLREACEHGTFLPALERLNLAPRAAQQYMGVTRRFAANTKSASHFEGLGVGKLVELLPLDDEQIEDLVGLGETGELKLDDVASMSLKQLRAGVRELRIKLAARDTVAADDRAKITDLQEQLARRESLDPTEREAAVMEELRAAALEAETGVRRLLCVAARETLNPATESSQLLAGQMVDFVAQVFAQLSNEAGLTVDFTELVRPSWARPDLGLGPGSKAD